MSGKKSDGSTIMSKYLIDSTVKLSDGRFFPRIALGVYLSEGKECVDAVAWALEAGYRAVDSASCYHNEKECGIAINSWLKKSVFFSTKLWDPDHGYERTKAAIDKSLRECNLGYIDLYLIHSPNPGKEKRLASWRAMEEAVAQGIIKSIGVSNYGVHHLQELLDAKPKILPSVNQVEINPFITRNDIVWKIIFRRLTKFQVSFCEKHHIVIEVLPNEASDPKLVSIAEKYKPKSVVHLLIRWCLQRGFVVLPKSVTKERIIENSDVFDFCLSPEDVEALNSLDEYRVIDWDPTVVP
ncbi:putative oxidoreductase [Neolecta irregularis DAH-3]|uniref:Putative oxidoreductase n=1 Tax=Neolecta irregularis (strain DAH-3) TaxID=1198029 RepID=A0A1U7LK01_NEOID|nr:putative oxidoreductase [Neolecta irregularis DAH-3]|eukprot:OLL22969.1 putative oxidoreductase [Neolecta irregularis DAH-3]